MDRNNEYIINELETMNTLIHHQSRNVLQGLAVTLLFQELPLDFLNNVILDLWITYTFKRTYGIRLSPFKPVFTLVP